MFIPSSSIVVLHVMKTGNIELFKCSRVLCNNIGDDPTYYKVIKIITCIVIMSLVLTLSCQRILKMFSFNI